MDVTRTISIPLTEVEIRTSRSSGPGGQHANTAETRVEAVFVVATSEALTDPQKRRLVERAGPVVRAVAQDTRSQARNRELVVERLTERIRAGLRVERRRRPTRPPVAADEGRLDDKRRRANVKRLRQTPPPE